MLIVDGKAFGQGKCVCLLVVLIIFLIMLFIKCSTGLPMLSFVFHFKTPTSAMLYWVHLWAVNTVLLLRYKKKMMWNVKGSFPSYEIMSHIYSRSSLILNCINASFCEIIQNEQGRKEGGGQGQH